jgi:hypothetical protein
MKRENGEYGTVCIVAVAVFLNAGVWAAEGKTQTTKYIDYVAELNRLGMAGRAESDNAAPGKKLRPEPPARNLQGRDKWQTSKGLFKSQSNDNPGLLNQHGPHPGGDSERLGNAKMPGGQGCDSNRGKQGN